MVEGLHCIRPPSCVDAQTLVSRDDWRSYRRLGEPSGSVACRPMSLAVRRNELRAIEAPRDREGMQWLPVAGVGSGRRGHHVGMR